MQMPSLEKRHQNKFNEVFYEEVNYLTFANRPSEDVFKPYFESCFEKEQTLFLVVGSDCGLLQEYVKKNVKHRFCRFIFIEFSNVIETLGLIKNSVDDLNDQTQQVWLFDETITMSALRPYIQSYTIRRQLMLLNSLAVMDAKEGEAYKELWEKTEVAFNHFLHEEYNSQSVKVFEEQRLLNLADNLIPAIKLKKPLTGRDAIILGGGPTLDDVIDWIKDNQDSLIIFAAARIADRLKREGIKADFFVTVDPFPWSFDNSKGVLAHAEDSVLIHSFHAQHRLISQWNGLSCYLGELYGWKETRGVRNIDTLGPTVTNSALHVAATLGATRIFLAGIDFCFANGKTHESFSSEAKFADTFAHAGKEMLEDNAGQMTETRSDFYMAKNAMEQMISFYLAHSPEIEFINLGLHSAKMKKVAYVPFNEIALKEPKHALIDEIRLQLVLSLDEQKEIVLEMLETLKKQQKRFKKIHDISAEAMLIADKVYDKNAQVIERNAKKIKKYQKKITNLVGMDGDFLTNYQAILFADSYKLIEDEKSMTTDEVTQQLKGFFGGLKAVTNEFLKLMVQSIERCELKVLELSSDSLPSELVDQWTKWKEFGRVLKWQQWHEQEALAADEKKLVETMVKNFYEEFDQTDHLHTQILEKNVNDVSKILSRANHALAKGNSVELEKIIEHVESLTSQTETQRQDFLNLLCGMLAELKDQKIEAFNFYEPIEFSILKHIALKKMLPISLELKDYQASLMVLERLVAIDLEYMISYSDMLRLLGNLTGAIEVLQMYLSQKPEAVSALIKLAQLYIDVGDLTKPHTLLSEALNIDPDNRSALLMQEELKTN